MRRLVAVLVMSFVVAGVAHADEIADVKALLTKAEKAISASDVEGAKAAMTDAKKLTGDTFPPIEYLEGKIAFEEGRYADAVKLLTASGSEDESGSFLRLAKDTLALTQKDAHVESAHFIFSYPPGKDEVLAPYALDTLESMRTALEHDLGHVPPGKIRVEVVNDAEELSKVSTLTVKSINTTGTIAICKFSKLMVTSPKAVASGYDWQDTLSHEFTHLVVTQLGHNTVPIWLQEGLAKYLETRWRGPAGEAMSPSQKALLAQRIADNKLVPFAKMHPSMALLPNWEDAATAFAEVFYAADYIFKRKGAPGLRAIVEGMAKGLTDREAVAQATGQTFEEFEKSWMAHIKAQPFPKGLIPPSDDKVVLKGSADDPSREKPAKKDKGAEVSFRDFAEVTEQKPRQSAHLGELFRARNRMAAAAEEFSKAYASVGDKYETVSNKYALSLLALKRLDLAEKVLHGSLKMHPGSAQTEVHLGRIYLARKDFPKARTAFLGALALDPFDPEIHISLLAAANGLKDTALADRARQASVTLTGWTTDKVDHVARNLAPDSSPH